MNPNTPRPYGFPIPWDWPQTIPPWPQRLPGTSGYGWSTAMPGGLPGGGGGVGPAVSGWILTLLPHQYAYPLESTYLLTAGIDTLIASEPAPGLRNFVLIRNIGTANNALVSFGVTAGLNSPLVLTPGTMVVFDSAVPQNEIHATASAATTNVCISVGTFNPPITF